MDIFRKFLGKNNSKGPELETIKQSEIKYTAPFKDGIAKALIHTEGTLFKISTINDKNQLIETSPYQYHNSNENGGYDDYIIAKDTKDPNLTKYLFDKNLDKVECLPYGEYSFTRITDGYIWVFALGAGFTKRGVINKNLKEVVPPIYKAGIYLGDHKFEMDTGHEKEYYIVENGVGKKI